MPRHFQHLQLGGFGKFPAAGFGPFGRGELRDHFVGGCWQSGQDIAQVGLGVDSPAAATLDERVDDGAALPGVGVSTYTMLDNAPYSSTVLQNELGPSALAEAFPAIANEPTPHLPNPSGMPTIAHHTAAAVLTPDSDGELRALGLFTQLADVLVEVEIFDAWDNGPSDFLGSGNYTLDDIGYFQVELPESLTLTASDSIVVQLTYLDAETLDPAIGALGITIAGSGLNFDIDTNSVAEGLSYYLDGSAWTDFATIDYPFVDEAENVTGGVLFLKGITAVPEPSALLLILAAAAALVLLRLFRNRKAPSQN
jgi:hypothetical protein